MMLDEPIIWQFEGREIKVEGFTQKVQDAFCSYMHNKLLAELQRMRGPLGTDYLPLLQRHVQRQARGELGFGSVEFFEFLNAGDDYPHLAQLLWTVMNKHQVVQDTDVDRWVKEKTQEASDLFDKLNETCMSTAQKKSVKAEESTNGVSSQS